LEPCDSSQLSSGQAIKAVTSDAADEFAGKISIAFDKRRPAHRTSTMNH
jgi:hypothetical protein